MRNGTAGNSETVPPSQHGWGIFPRIDGLPTKNTRAILKKQGGLKVIRK